MQDLPERPFTLAPPDPFRPADRRELRISGATVELVWLPERAARGGVPTDDRPAFRPSPAERIAREEAVWRAGGLVLTPNRYPFGAGQLMLWTERPEREVSLHMLEAALELTERSGGSALLNTIGAAASIPRCHVHLMAERRAFLEDVPLEPFEPDFLSDDDLSELECVRTVSPAPAAAVGLRGPLAGRARAAHRLLELRTTPACNLVAVPGCCWVFPRSAVEIPAPDFPHALGAAEVWGRWCYAGREAFREATTEDLARALARRGLPPASVTGRAVTK